MKSCHLIVLSRIFFESTVRKVSKYGVFSGPYFPAFGLNTEIYLVNLSIQSEYGKTQTRRNSVFGYFSRSEYKSKKIHALSKVAMYISFDKK